MLDSKKVSERKEGAVGIDLGTTHSLVAVADEGAVQLLPLGNGSPLVPSLFAWDGMRVLCGSEATSLRHERPEAVLSSTKRFMGGRIPEGIDALSTQQDATRGLVLSIGEKTWTPVEIAATLLQMLKKKAEAYLGHPVTQAVITVPAYFDETARQATRQAAHVAGLKVLRLLSEPTAAALAYGLDQKFEGTWGIFDLGGGTFDFSLLKMEKGVFQVIGTGGDLALGGDDFDALIAQKRVGMDAWPHLDVAERLRELKTARTIKEELSSASECEGISRADFEILSAPLVDRMMGHVASVLADAALSPHEIQGIILVGGATRIPLIQKELTRFFGRAPLCHLDPDQVVAHGAALQAEALTTGGRHLLLDVTPISLGIEVLGGKVERLIHRNTRIPVSITQTFSTSVPGQTALRIHVLQGESDHLEGCRSLAQFILKDIPPLPAGHPRIDVTFTLDTDGLLTVQAEERTSHQKQTVEVKPTYGLTVDMMRDILLKANRCETS